MSSATTELHDNKLYQLICEKRKDHSVHRKSMPLQPSDLICTDTHNADSTFADDTFADDDQIPSSLPPVVRLSSLRPASPLLRSVAGLSLHSSSPAPKPQDDLDLLRSRIQATFLSYRSPNTTPKQYVSHAQLLESFKDLADSASGPNAFSVASASCSCQRPHAHAPRFPSVTSVASGEHASGKTTTARSPACAGGRCECEGVHGVVEMRGKRGSRPPEKVKLTIQSSSGKMILAIMGGSDYGTEVGFIRLEESYVATYGDKPLTFAVGLRSKRECFEESEIHFSCHTSRSRDKWVGALVQGGSRSKRMLLTADQSGSSM